MTAREWLNLLWPDGAPGAGLSLWSPKDGAIKCTTDLDLVAAMVTDEPEIFVSCGALTAEPEEHARGTAAMVGWIPGVWLDVDHATAWRKGNCELADLDACLDLVSSVEAPTAIVQTGGGVHAWWLFDEPISVGASGRAACARLLRGWHALHRGAGASVGGTHDLARVLRPVGSVHTRGAAPQPVDVLGSVSGRYSLAALERRLPRWLPPTAPAVSDPTRSHPLQPSSSEGVAQYDGPVSEHPWVVEAISHRGAIHPSNRAWDMAVIRACLRASPTCNDETIAAAVRTHRQAWGGEERIRPADLAMSIDRARQAV